MEGRAGAALLKVAIRVELAVQITLRLRVHSLFNVDVHTSMQADIAHAAPTGFITAQDVSLSQDYLFW